MTANSSPRFRAVKLGAAALLAGLSLSACAPQTMPPQQVQANNPQVTYKYRGDQELIQAEQNASTFCSRYNGVPRTVSLGNDTDGNKVVVFECVSPSAAPVVAGAPPAVVAAPGNPLVYSYSTDQQLLTASSNAQAYCLSRGMRQVTSTVVNNPNGTRTITFQCGPG